MNEQCLCLDSKKGDKVAVPVCAQEHERYYPTPPQPTGNWSWKSSACVCRTARNIMTLTSPTPSPEGSESILCAQVRRRPPFFPISDLFIAVIGVILEFSYPKRLHLTFLKAVDLPVNCRSWRERAIVMMWLPTCASFCLCMVPLGIVSVHPVVCLPSSTFLCLRLHCALYAFVCAVCNVVLMVVFFVVAKFGWLRVFSLDRFSGSEDRNSFSWLWRPSFVTCWTWSVFVFYRRARQCSARWLNCFHWRTCDGWNPELG